VTEIELLPANLTRVGPSVARAGAVLRERTQLVSERLRTREMLDLLGDSSVLQFHKQRQRALGFGILYGYIAFAIVTASLLIPGVHLLPFLFSLSLLFLPAGRISSRPTPKQGLLPTDGQAHYRWVVATDSGAVEAILIEVQAMGKQWAVTEVLYDSFQSVEDTAAYMVAVDSLLPADDGRELTLPNASEPLLKTLSAGQ
jgi:hypothetical protein